MYTCTPATPGGTCTGAPVGLISRVRVTWGPCIANAVNGQPNQQASVQAQTVLPIVAGTPNSVPGAVVTLYVFPVGLNPICLVAYNSDGAGGESGPTNTLVIPGGIAPGNPIPIPGNPVILNSTSK